MIIKKIKPSIESFIFLVKIMMEDFNNATKTRMQLSIWAFIVCLALGSGEAILFSGGLSFYLLVGQFLLLSNINNEVGGEWNNNV